MEVKVYLGRFREEFNRAAPTLEELEALGSLTDPFKELRFELAQSYGYVPPCPPTLPETLPSPSPSPNFKKLVRVLSKSKRVPSSSAKSSPSIVKSPPSTSKSPPSTGKSPPSRAKPTEPRLSHSSYQPFPTLASSTEPQPSRKRSFSAPFVKLARRVSLSGPVTREHRKVLEDISPNVLNVNPLRRSFEIFRPNSSQSHKAAPLTLIVETPQDSYTLLEQERDLNRQEKELSFSKRSLHSVPPSPHSSRIISRRSTLVGEKLENTNMIRTTSSSLLSTSRPPSPPLNSQIRLPLACASPSPSLIINLPVTSHLTKLSPLVVLGTSITSTLPDSPTDANQSQEFESSDLTFSEPNSDEDNFSVETPTTDTVPGGKELIWFQQEGHLPTLAKGLDKKVELEIESSLGAKTWVW